MKYEEAKRKQIDEFKKGNYYVLREQEGSFVLIPAANAQVAKDSITRDAIAEVKRLKVRYRIIQGGKK